MRESILHGADIDLPGELAVERQHIGVPHQPPDVLLTHFLAQIPDEHALERVREFVQRRNAQVFHVSGRVGTVYAQVRELLVVKDFDVLEARFVIEVGQGVGMDGAMVHDPRCQRDFFAPRDVGKHEVGIRVVEQLLVYEQAMLAYQRDAHHLGPMRAQRLMEERELVE